MPLSLTRDAGPKPHIAEKNPRGPYIVGQHLACSWECHGTGYGHSEECATFFCSGRHSFALVDILRISGCESTMGILTGVALLDFANPKAPLSG